ncbi:MAG: fasciclin domain-containing protein [Actinomycetota bacterium]
MTSRSWIRGIGVSAAVMLAACGGGEGGEGPDPTGAATTDSATGSTQSPDSTLSPEDAFLEDVGYEGGTIATILGDSSLYSTIYAALGEAGLLEMFEGTGPFTFFVPVDKAFEELPDGVLDKLLLPENRDTLIQILRYHVVEGDYRLANLTNGELTTLQGTKISIEVSSSMNVMEVLKVDGRFVVVPNLKATNGTLHIINWLMVPPGVDLNAL